MTRKGSKRRSEISKLEATLCSDLTQIGTFKSLKELEELNRAGMEFLNIVRRDSAGILGRAFDR